MKFFNYAVKTDTDKATILIRFIVGYIFIMEGIQKFVYSETLGVGRFIKIGIPYAEIMAPLVGTFEIIFGFFILVGFVTRLAAIPQIIIMLTALATTKLSLISEKGLLTFSHDARNDLLMLFGLIFLLIKGSGATSIDQKIMKMHRMS
jgi:putative oxidoreductase